MAAALSYFRSLLIAISGIILFRNAINSLEFADKHAYTVFSISIATQASIFEGSYLFFLYSKSFKFCNSRIPYYALKIIIYSLMSSFLFCLYLTYSIEGSVIVLTALFLFGAIFINLSNLTVAIYSSSKFNLNYFLIDILCTLVCVAASFHAESLFLLALLFSLRFVGTFSLAAYLTMRSLFKMGLHHIVRNQKNRAKFSKQYSAASAVSVIKDGGFLLLSGILLGGQTVIDLRIFNTVVSTLGLVFAPINKILVRYYHGEEFSERYFIFALYLFAVIYLVPWVTFNGEMLNYLFGDSFTFDEQYFISALVLYLAFWPVSQLLQFRIFRYGNARYQLISTLTWLGFSLPLLAVLLHSGINLYIIIFGLIQVVNLFLLFSFKKN